MTNENVRNFLIQSANARPLDCPPGTYELGPDECVALDDFETETLMRAQAARLGLTYEALSAYVNQGFFSVWSVKERPEPDRPWEPVSVPVWTTPVWAGDDPCYTTFGMPTYGMPGSGFRVYGESSFECSADYDMFCESEPKESLVKAHLSVLRAIGRVVRAFWSEVILRKPVR